jgi:AraC-like DNA-binding protein
MTRVETHPRVLAVLPPDGERDLSHRMWAQLNIAFARSISEATGIIRLGRGGFVIYDPFSIGASATADLLTAAEDAGASVILYFHLNCIRQPGALPLILRANPVDVILANFDRIPEALASRIAASAASAVPLLIIRHLASRTARLSPHAKAATLDPFISGHRIRSARELANRHDVSLRTLQRDFGRAGLRAPGDFLRAASVAACWETLRYSSNSLSISAKQAGFSRVSSLGDAFKWAIGMPPRQSVAELTPAQVASAIARTLSLSR